MKSDLHKNFDRKIEDYYKEKNDTLLIEMTPREIWQIAKEIDPHTLYAQYFYELEQGKILSMFYRGAKIIRKEVKI